MSGCICDFPDHCDGEREQWGLEMHGKKIKAIFWPQCPGIRKAEIRASEDCEISLSATYHGDHDETWIVVCKDGREMERHNTRYVESIIWE